MGKFSLDRNYLAIIALPVVVFFTGEFLIAIFAAHSSGFDSTSIRIERPFAASVLATESAQRMKMLGLFFLMCGISCGIVWRWNSERRTLFDQKSGNLMFAAVALCVVSGVAVIALGTWEGLPRTFDLLGRNVFEAAFAGIADTSDAPTRNPMTPFKLDLLIHASGVLVSLVVGCLVATAISCLAKAGPLSDGDSHSAKAHWKFQSERLQFTIYLATALLVAGILFIDSWTHWPEFAFKPEVKEAAIGAQGSSKTIGPESLAAFKSLASSAVVFTGIHYSLLLGSFALPVAYFMSRDANLIAERSIVLKREKDAKLGSDDQAPQTEARTVAPSRADIEAEKEAEKLKLSLMDQVKAVIAILAPFIAGSIGNVAGLLGAK